MHTANMRIQIDSKTKRQILKFVKDFDIDLNLSINNFLRGFIKAGKIGFVDKYWQSLFKKIKTSR